MTKRLNFLLLDANVIIELWRLDLWQRLVGLCDIHVGKTVVDEAAFFIDEGGLQRPIDLGPDIDGKRITVFQVELDEVAAFRSQYDLSYFERIDPGEAEALVRLVGQATDWRLCSADGIVFKILANIQRGEQGISLEEILDKVGLTRRLSKQYTKAFRTGLSRLGAIDLIQDRGRKK